MIEEILEKHGVNPTKELIDELCDYVDEQVGYAKLGEDL